MTLPINKVVCGDCVEVLKDFPVNSIDCVVTDPPYGISFMQKDWDQALPPKEAFNGIFRVLKPGALAFVMSSPRQDVLWRMLRMLEDCGFQLRQSFVSWIYKSGFPKAYDVSKGIDKRNARRRQQYLALASYLRQKRIEKGLSQKDVAKHFPSKTGGLTGCIWNWENAVNVPTKREWLKLKELLDLDDQFNLIINRTQAERKIIGRKSGERYKYDFKDNSGHFVDTQNVPKNKRRNDVGALTEPATNMAEKWSGWKSVTGLKPALECVLMVNKPMSEPTIVDNVLRHGTGAINVDACRIPFQSKEDFEFGHHNKQLSEPDKEPKSAFGAGSGFGLLDSKIEKGRFPANLLVSDKALDTGKITKSSPVGFKNVGWRHSGNTKDEMTKMRYQQPYGDIGGSSRYFDLDAWARHHGFLDVPKASKQEREMGLKRCDGKISLRYGNGTSKGDSFRDKRPHTRENYEYKPKPTRNIHPTVKPVKLMAYLIELGCPPEGVVLDPFVGTGTTLIAAHQLNRKWIGIDVEPEYINIAKHRLATLDAKLQDFLT